MSEASCDERHKDVLRLQAGNDGGTSSHSSISKEQKNVSRFRVKHLIQDTLDITIIQKACCQTEFV